VPNPGDSEDAAWWEALGVQTVVILILLGMIIAAMVALLVMRRKDPSAEWAHLAQGTYGIQNQERWDDDDMGMLASPTVAPPPMDAQPVGVAQVAPVDDYNFSKRRAGDLVQEYDLPSVDVLVQEARYHDDNQDQYLNTQELTSAAKALRSGQQRDDDLDMSFLDDLL
jgi:3-oxoacyl-(acyl-carrier-protein) synthase